LARRAFWRAGLSGAGVGGARGFLQNGPRFWVSEHVELELELPAPCAKA
jgi:hypothetical protein